MKLYNTLNRRVEQLQPIEPPLVTVYTCGPTVYDYPHVGNWFTFIRYDLLIRTLTQEGYKPKWVLNITDVGHLTSDADEGEDKMDAKAKREHKTAWEIADFYTDYFKTGLERLNFTLPMQLPRATAHITEQIEMITALQTKGYTYKIDDGIYFDTSKFSKYRDFAALDLEEQQAGARIDINPQKKQASDFALWKFSPTDKVRDMQWDSPWGIGFPGWHIECSAMCLKYLGKTIDIHCGGIDHIAVHHSNEIAQSEASNQAQLAHIWMHSNHILINDQKIAKSTGNGITLEDILDHGFSFEAFRLHVIESHYRSQSKFSWKALGSAQNRLLRYRNFAALRFQTGENQQHLPKPDLTAAMSDDLNTPLALSRLEEFITQSEKHNLAASVIDDVISLVDNLFGISLAKVPDISDQQKQLIVQRENARSSGNWVRADELRDQLENQSIGLNDRPNGPIWHYLK